MYTSATDRVPFRFRPRTSSFTTEFLLTIFEIGNLRITGSLDFNWPLQGGAQRKISEYVWPR